MTEVKNSIENASTQPTQPAQTQPGQAAPDVETQAYVPTYKVKPEMKKAVLAAIGDLPFNQIAGIMNAINVPKMDHNTLTQVINVLGNFPYLKVADLLTQIGSLVEQEMDDDD